jgi:hypothetical protein
MRYGLTQPYLGNHYFLDLSEEEFRSAKKVKSNLLELLGFEEKLAFVLDNFVEYEQELLKLTLASRVYHIPDWSNTMDRRHLINRRIINLFTACRLYLDQTAHFLSTIYGKKSTNLQYYDSIRSEAYESTLGYRVCEALRNYVQHRGMPVYGLKRSESRIEEATRSYVKNTIDPYLDPAKLQEDGGFKVSVLTELLQLGERVPLKPLIRAYISSLASIHNNLRETLNNDVVYWESNLNDFIDRYVSVTDKPSGSVYLVAQDSAQRFVEKTVLMRDFIERRQALVQKTLFLGNYESMVISSE